MKRKLVTTLVLICLGYYGASAELISTAWEWWKAPPSISPDAQKLITSIEQDAWKLCERDESIRRGDIMVEPKTLWANIHINGVKHNNQFSFTDARAINTAARKRMRQLVVRAVNEINEPTLSEKEARKKVMGAE